ncbi:hypothetical protein D3C77_803850 [compost metagenome]
MDRAVVSVTKIKHSGEAFRLLLKQVIVSLQGTLVMQGISNKYMHVMGRHVLLCFQ